MGVEFLDPRAVPAAPVEPYALRLDPSAEPLTIGLLANGFPDSGAFLAEVEAALAAVLPGAAFRHYDKGSPSIVVPEPMLVGITEECTAVVAAYGH